MKIWCSLNSNPANKWCESWALWSSSPVAYFYKIFLGKLLLNYPMQWTASRTQLIDLFFYFWVLFQGRGMVGFRASIDN
jgi:hypothetical protein